MKKPIFILGAHKSGTSLLRSLLDGHPSLFSLPMETHPFQLSHHWVDYRFRATRPKLLSVEETKDAYIKWVEHYNRKSDPLADSDLVKCLNLSVFKDFMKQDTRSFQELVSQYFQGIYRALHEDTIPAHLRIVEKSVEHAEFAMDLHRLFPDAFFIHIIRNPYSNLVALKNYLRRSTKYFYPFLGKAILALNNSYYFLDKNLRFIDRYLLIRYEDLLQHPRSTMKDIAQFVDVEYLKVLLNPTSAGKTWAGNSSRGIKFSEISAFNLDIWESEINHLEIELVNQNFDFFLEQYHYKKISPQKHWLLPVSWELPHTYLLNRAIKKFV